MTYPKKKAIFVNGKFIHKLIRFNVLEILLLSELPKIEINENRRMLIWFALGNRKITRHNYMYGTSGILFSDLFNSNGMYVCMYVIDISEESINNILRRPYRLLAFTNGMNVMLIGLEIFIVLIQWNGLHSDEQLNKKYNNVTNKNWVQPFDFGFCTRERIFLIFHDMLRFSFPWSLLYWIRELTAKIIPSIKKYSSPTTLLVVLFSSIKFYIQNLI